MAIRVKILTLGGQHTWNLGSIAPLESLTVTLTLSAPASVAAETALDAGATASGRWPARWWPACESSV